MSDLRFEWLWVEVDCWLGLVSLGFALLCRVWLVVCLFCLVLQQQTASWGGLSVVKQLVWFGWRENTQEFLDFVVWRLVCGLDWLCESIRGAASDCEFWPAKCQGVSKEEKASFLSWQENYFLVKSDWESAVECAVCWQYGVVSCFLGFYLPGKLGLLLVWRDSSSSSSRLSVFWARKIEGRFSATNLDSLFINDKVNLEPTGSSVYWILDEKNELTGNEK